MRGQKNMSQMKEKGKTTTKELNEMEINNTPDKESKVMVIKIFTGFEKKVEDLSETFNKEKGNIKESIRHEELNDRN